MPRKNSSSFRKSKTDSNFLKAQFKHATDNENLYNSKGEQKAPLRVHTKAALKLERQKKKYPKLYGLEVTETD